MGDIPQALLAEIRTGSCTAFVGAGFSAIAVPAWGELLAGIARHEAVGPPVRRQVEAILQRPGMGILSYEAAAQLLRDELPGECFDEILGQQMRRDAIDNVMTRRLRLLQEIPFRAVLTTNFDELLPGELPGREAYSAALRAGASRWWHEAFWTGAGKGRPVVKLHGDIAKDPRSVVFTRRDYRSRMYESPGYATFLRSVFATSTMLYLGVSFSDTYLNELRSEVLALFQHRKGDAPIAYAVVNDIGEGEQRYLLEHEGICVITYDTRRDPIHSGFDAILSEIHARTNAHYNLGLRLQGRRVLWVDPHPDYTAPGARFLQRAAEQAAGRGFSIEFQPRIEQALARLEAEPHDLVITHWGHHAARDDRGDPCANAQALLRQMHRREIEAPVIVFAGGDHADENRRKALRLGALAYVSAWPRLFQEIDELFAPAEEVI